MESVDGKSEKGPITPAQLPLSMNLILQYQNGEGNEEIFYHIQLLYHPQNNTTKVYFIFSCKLFLPT